MHTQLNVKKQMEIQISDTCRQTLPDLRGRHYDLVGPGGEIILPRTWELTIQPGWTISIVFSELSNENCTHRNTTQGLDICEANQDARMDSGEEERQREREQWAEERREERRLWAEERREERQLWAEETREERRLWQEERQGDFRRELDRRISEVHDLRRSEARANLGTLCKLHSSLCWLSGHRRRCHFRE